MPHVSHVLVYKVVIAQFPLQVLNKIKEKQMNIKILLFYSEICSIIYKNIKFETSDKIYKILISQGTLYWSYTQSFGPRPETDQIV